MVAQSAWRRFVTPPDTWEAWAQRVMSVLMAVLLVVSYLLLHALSEVAAFQQESRSQRNIFQIEETARQCAILRGQGLADDELRALRC